MSMSRDLAEWGWSKADFQWADEAQKVANSERGGGGGGGRSSVLKDSLLSAWWGGDCWEIDASRNGTLRSCRTHQLPPMQLLREVSVVYMPILSEVCVTERSRVQWPVLSRTAAVK